MDKKFTSYVGTFSITFMIIKYLLEWCYRFLENLTSPEVEYTVAMTAYWAIEAVYQESFAHCLEEGSKTPPELQEVCQRWGNDGFGSYCSALRSIADRLLLKSSDDEM